MMPDSLLLLHAQGLRRTFGGHAAVDDVSLELRRGEVLGFLGPNGAGKSTTMRMLAGNLRPDSGSVSLCGIDLWKEPLKAKGKLGYLPEIPPLYRDMNVDGYLKFAARLRGVQKIPLTETKRRCGLENVGGRLIGSLSKGYQQRVGIAQAIIHDPEVVIMDEPTAGLDPNQIRETRALIRELGNRHGVILSTHILSEVESLCDRVEILHRGKQVYSGEVGGEGASIEAGFRNPPSREELLGLEGVAAVEAVSPALFLVRPIKGCDPTESLIRMASERDWGLQRINPARNPIEKVFAELTKEGS